MSHTSVCSAIPFLMGSLLSVSVHDLAHSCSTSDLALVSARLHQALTEQLPISSPNIAGLTHYQFLDGTKIPVRQIEEAFDITRRRDRKARLATHNALSKMLWKWLRPKPGSPSIKYMPSAYISSLAPELKDVILALAHAKIGPRSIQDVKAIHQQDKTLSMHGASLREVVEPYLKDDEGLRCFCSAAVHVEIPRTGTEVLERASKRKWKDIEPDTSVPSDSSSSISTAVSRKQTAKQNPSNLLTPTSAPNPASIYCFGRDSSIIPNSAFRFEDNPYGSSITLTACPSQNWSDADIVNSMPDIIYNCYTPSFGWAIPPT